MAEIFADAISYSISSDNMATVQSCDNCLSVRLPRTSVPFDGKLVRVTVLRRIDVADLVDTILIPRSIRRLCGRAFNSQVRSGSLVFELWSELECIGTSAFQCCPLQCIFISQSIDFIRFQAFADCNSITYVYFDSHSSLWQFKSENFARLSNLRTIMIPASIR
jgi:hypothetical protein